MRARKAAIQIEPLPKIGAISYDGDSWYAASSEGGAGLGYDECEAAMKEGFAALNRIAAALPAPAPEKGEGDE